MKMKTNKSIKAVGLIISIFSALIVFSNFMGVIIYFVLGIGEASNIGYFFEFFLILCVMMIVIGILYLLSGIYVRKCKIWANKLATVISALLIMFIFFILFYFIEQISVFVYSPYFFSTFRNNNMVIKQIDYQNTFYLM
jgi:hypothetical protein